MDRYNWGDLGFPRFFGVLLLAMTVVGTVDLILDDPKIWLSVYVFVDVGFILLCLGRRSTCGAVGTGRSAH